MTMVLEKLYYNPAHYADYLAVDNLARTAKPNFFHDEIVRWLESQNVYTLYNPLRRKFPRLHCNVWTLRSLGIARRSLV